MKRIQIEKPKDRRGRPWLEPLPLDPRDPGHRSSQEHRSTFTEKGDEHVMFPSFALEITKGQAELRREAK